MLQAKPIGRGLTGSILSLSLLTVMAGAAVAPALNVIQAHFAQSSQTFVQMIISIPALFIVITNFFFPKLCRRLNTRTLVLLGLSLYTAGGCAAGLFDQIGLVLVMRALVGVGVGILMPLSTGLLTDYFPPEKQASLLGISSAMNQLGGVIATLLAGLLAGISWRASFLVYLLGLGSILLCLRFLPKGGIPRQAPTAQAADTPAPGGLRTFFVYVLAMFLLMSIFFLYPANFALETSGDGVIGQQYIAAIMAGADLVALFGGLLFVRIQGVLRGGTKVFSPLLFLVGYLLLTFLGGLGRHPAGVCLHRLCQRRRHPLPDLRGRPPGGEGRHHHRDAPAVGRPVPGPVPLPPPPPCPDGNGGGRAPSLLLLRPCHCLPVPAVVPAHPRQGPAVRGGRDSFPTPNPAATAGHTGCGECAAGGCPSGRSRHFSAHRWPGCGETGLPYPSPGRCRWYGEHRRTQ